jgi:hypothetical protein
LDLIGDKKILSGLPFGRFLDSFGRFLESFGRFLESFGRFLECFGRFFLSKHLVALAAIHHLSAASNTKKVFFLSFFIKKFSKDFHCARRRV